MFDDVKTLLKTGWFQTFMSSKSDTVENKWKNIGILYILNVTFGNFYDCDLSNKFRFLFSKN